MSEGSLRRYATCFVDHMIQGLPAATRLVPMFMVGKGLQEPILVKMEDKGFVSVEPISQITLGFQSGYVTSVH